MKSLLKLEFVGSVLQEDWDYFIILIGHFEFANLSESRKERDDANLDIMNVETGEMRTPTFTDRCRFLSIAVLTEYPH